jgi:hypothetical protein
MKMLRITLFYLIIFALFIYSAPAHGQEPGGENRLFAPVCALSSSRLVCYISSNTPLIISPDGAAVVDFAAGPDGEWLVFRTEEGDVYTANMSGEALAQIDSEALPPPALDILLPSIAWAPDGLAIAYITAQDLRVIQPQQGVAKRTDFTDRLYTAVKFSPAGSRLAARDINDTWVLFAMPLSADGNDIDVRRAPFAVGTVDTPADADWMDDNSLIVAPKAGGAIRFNFPTPEAAPIVAWNKPEGVFGKLQSSPDGTVRAMLFDPLDDTRGTTISIGVDGSISSIGGQQIDARAEWTNGGAWLMYYAGGTPILIDPATGLEESLPLSRVNKAVWMPPSLILAGALAMDGDIYLLVPDEEGIVQLWHFPGDGQRGILQVTKLPSDVVDFSISPDRRYAALSSGRKLILFPLSQAINTITPTPTGSLLIITPTPRAEAVPGAPDALILASLIGGESASPAWRQDSNQIIYSDGGNLYLTTLPTPNTPLLPPLLFANAPSGGRYVNPSYSLDRRFISAVRQGQNTTDIFPLTSVPSQPIGNVSTEMAVWGPIGLLSAVRGSDNRFTVGLTADGITTTVAGNQPPVVDIRAVGGAGQALFLRNAGWRFGPVAAQLGATTNDPAKPEIRTLPIPLMRPSISPTGRFAAAMERANIGNTYRLTVTDLQNGRKVVIRNTLGIVNFQWVR